ncbi:hypothetical protein EIP86_003232 [Pleurotus ostreatoroseus]|nr:hypothetical protein EIP86_003232 [Pleurotus ostreatoroseus]
MSDSSVQDEKYDLTEKQAPRAYPRHAALLSANSPTDAVKVETEFDDPNLGEDAEYLEDDSPYPEVRAAVANTDDPDMPCATFRAWFVGMIWAILIAGLDQFFFFRFPSVTITSIVAQLISFPIMRVWARFVPRVKIFGIALNPGPFTIKEHVIITVMANVGSGSAYAVSHPLVYFFGDALLTAVLRRISSQYSGCSTTRTQPSATRGSSSCRRNWSVLPTLQRPRSKLISIRRLAFPSAASRAASSSSRRR